MAVVFLGWISTALINNSLAWSRFLFDISGCPSGWPANPTCLKLYFDKFESELADTVSEPTNQAYDMAKDEEDQPEIELSESIIDEIEIEIGL
mgnify:CR=1 FL=1